MSKIDDVLDSLVEGKDMGKYLDKTWDNYKKEIIAQAKQALLEIIIREKPTAFNEDFNDGADEYAKRLTEAFK